ncbi:transmembrane protein 135-like [Aricia agestis]|uniref:transmembrane protein 135-like n=1 Tax=Aricia agestis TaxID=91739 RepID=UPI001C2077F1|nr:transmembrane protein 135-like [Aricia agestis]
MMAEISKHLFDSICRDLHCSQIVHPWTKSCFDVWPILQFFIGSAKFYLVVHLVQNLLKGKKFKTREDVRRALEYYLRSTLLGALVCSTSVSGACFFRWLLGRRFNYYTYIFIPNMLNGLFILLEPPSRRGLVVNLFCNMVVEYWLRSLEHAGWIRITKLKMTLLFMLGSSLLFYLMRLEGEKTKRTPLLWLYTPEKVKHKEPGETPCPHSGPCSKYILKGTATYFSAGLAFTVVNLLRPLLKSPLTTLSSLSGKHLKLAMFLGSYIGIYRLIICWLCHKRGSDSAAHALPAGAIAGLSFLFKPSLGVAIAALSGAFKIFSTTLYEKKMITEKVDLPLMLYCLSQGTLFHARCMHPRACPSYVFNLIKSVSNGYVDLTYASIEEAIKRRVM